MAVPFPNYDTSNLLFERLCDETRYESGSSKALSKRKISKFKEKQEHSQ